MRVENISISCIYAGNFVIIKSENLYKVHCYYLTGLYYEHLTGED
jgi:hypothetical protein